MFKKKSFQVMSIVVIVLALASISCGVSNLPFLATETPTPTQTFTPSPTLTSTPSATPTPTELPTNTPQPAGIHTEEQTDGSTIINDYDNKYQLIVSGEWVAIPFDQDELGKLVEEVSKNNPQFKEAAAALKNLDPDVFRFVALNQNKNYFKNGSAPNINITALDNKILATMPLSFVTGALEELLAQNGAKVVTDGVNTIDNPNGVEIEFIEVQQSVNGIKIAQRVIVFQSNDKLIMLTITSPEGVKADVFKSGDEIAASIQLFK
ncbi:MAG: hypothetical protein QM730_06550 [Anaerolineales bacterium]